MSWYLEVLKKYTVFSGRARRKEYWMFILFNLLIGFLLGFIDGAAGLGLPGESGYGLLGGLYTLGIIIPGIAVSVRRLHDTGRSGWWLLIGLVPLIGIILIGFMIQDSQQDENEFGPNPKTAPA